jgi:hypothetical protein
MILVAALVTTSCATTMNVSSHVDRQITFSQYRTYDWGPADALPTGDPRLDGNPFFHDHLQGAIEKGLPSRGLVKSTSTAPDLLLHYHANIDQRIAIDRIDTAHGYCYDDDCRIGATEYELGTLVLDMVDTRTNRVIWRGWAEDRVEGMLSNPDTMERKINEAVSRMLERLPRSF